MASVTAEPTPTTQPDPKPTQGQDDLYLGLLAIRNEFVNLSELKHCLEVRRKLAEKEGKAPELGDVLVQQRYLTPQDLEYLNMIRLAESNRTSIVTLKEIEDEFQSHVASIKPGAEFGRYQIQEEIGRGGMGVVWLAQDKEHERECALKVLIGREEAAVRDIERFKKEATVMMPLEHHNIVAIYEVSREKGLDYISMEYVRGKNLKDMITADGPFEAARALRVVRSAAEAVAFIHTHGIIHRDIKPENIMVRPDGSAVLMDFGLAGWDKIEVLAGRGSIGTPMYQPPEQADVGGPFGKISEASDVYGLGATLYYLLTGRHPFLGKSVKEVREKIKTAPPDPPRAIRPEIPQVAEAICLRCLRKKQAERFPKPKDLIEAIDQVLSIIDPEGKTATNGKSAGAKTGKTTKLAIQGALRRGGFNTGKLAALKKQKSDQGKVDPALAAQHAETADADPPAGPGAPRAAAAKLAKRSSQVRRGFRSSAEGQVDEDGQPRGIPWATVLPIVLIGGALIGLLVGALLLFKH